MEIVKNFENKLLGRNEVVAKLEVENTTLSRSAAKTQLAKILKVDEKLIIIKEILTSFGSKAVEVVANIYENEEVLNKTSRDHLIKRNAPAKAETGEE